MQYTSKGKQKWLRKKAWRAAHLGKDAKTPTPEKPKAAEKKPVEEPRRYAPETKTYKMR